MNPYAFGWDDIGMRFKHYEGGIVEVSDIALHTETDDILVIYKQLTDSDTEIKLHATPLNVFCEVVRFENEFVRRYTRLDDQDVSDLLKHRTKEEESVEAIRRSVLYQRTTLRDLPFGIRFNSSIYNEAIRVTFDGVPSVETLKFIMSDILRMITTFDKWIWESELPLILRRIQVESKFLIEKQCTQEALEFKKETLNPFLHDLILVDKLESDDLGVVKWIFNSSLIELNDSHINSRLKEATSISTEVAKELTRIKPFAVNFARIYKKSGRVYPEYQKRFDNPS